MRSDHPSECPDALIVVGFSWDLFLRPFPFRFMLGLTCPLCVVMLAVVGSIYWSWATMLVCTVAGSLPGSWFLVLALSM
jgi:hypothetical protein